MQYNMFIRFILLIWFMYYLYHVCIIYNIVIVSLSLYLYILCFTIYISLNNMFFITYTKANNQHNVFSFQPPWPLPHCLIGNSKTWRLLRRFIKHPPPGCWNNWPQRCPIGGSKIRHLPRKFSKDPPPTCCNTWLTCYPTK